MTVRTARPGTAGQLSAAQLTRAFRHHVSGAVAVGDAIAAVRQARAAARSRPRPDGQPKVTVPDEHFSCRHPLAGLARAMCETARHTAPKTGQGRPGEGKVACGGCWEAVIRADERGHTAAGAAR